MKKYLIKQKIMIPLFIILLLLTMTLIGCYDKVEMQGATYDKDESTVTLQGSAPFEDPLRRQILYDHGDPILEFRLYKKTTDKWDEEYLSIEKDHYSKNNDIMYFSSDIKNLVPDEKYHVRALAYYYDPWSELESGWGYSDMFTFIPNESDIYDVNFTANKNNNKNIYKVLEKNFFLKEILMDQYELEGYET